MPETRKAKYTCQDIANYFLALCDRLDAGDAITNLKLQKLVYYAQGFYLAITGRRLFNEQLEAWQHGPVVPELYHKYKQYGFQALEPDQDFQIASIDGDTRDILDEVYNVYGQFSAWKLRDLTHQEPPWLNAKERTGNTITTEDLKAFFKTQLRS